jgi:hypothetical protein
MYELPQGKNVVVEPSVTCQVLAAVKVSHTLKSVTTRAESWGLKISAARDNVDPAEFGVKAPDKGYRLVHVMGTSTKRVVVPWSTNKLVRVFDKSSLVKAWASEPPVGAAVNTQLTPAAGTGKIPAEPLHGFGGGRCPTCVNYAWSPEMGPSINAIDGTPHHPSCNRLVGLADTKMGRRVQRMRDRRGLPQLNAQLSPRR